jgi:hypothetical protein
MASSLLDAVCEQYLSSRDFNGLLMTSADVGRRDEAIAGVQAGLLQVVSEEDFPNPHIRPWPSRRTIDSQIASVERLGSDRYGLCLYPTPAALAERVQRMYLEEPYRQAMAEGRGALELAYFDFAVLEPYANDPRFTFEFSDFGAKTIVSDATHEDENEPEHDKIIMGHIGFAYDLTDFDREDPDSPIRRRIAAFYGDLAKLSARHQQRWRTYQLEDETGLRPHPVWIGRQMGHWDEGIGPFDLFFRQLAALNELWQRAFGEDLFRNTERPSGFGWLLRPTQREWDSFVLELDKLLSDNLRQEALDAAGAPRSDANGQQLGTLGRLRRLMIDRKINGAAATKVMGPLREVRQARQRPAHALRTNLTDQTFAHKQVVLLEEINKSLTGLRYFILGHPANRDWEEPEKLEENAQLYRM